MMLVRAGFLRTENPLFGWIYPREVEDRIKQQMLNIETAATHFTQEMRDGFRQAVGGGEPWVCACVGAPEGKPLTVKAHPSFKAKCNVCGCSEYKGDVNTSGIESVYVERVRHAGFKIGKIEAKDWMRGPFGEPWRPAGAQEAKGRIPGADAPG